MSERSSEADDPGFGRTVGGHSWGRLEACDAAEIDNATSSGLTLHNDIGPLAEHQDGREVDGDNGLEKSRRSRRRHGGRRPTGVVDEDVDMPKALLGNRDHFVNLVIIPNVALNAENRLAIGRSARVLMPATSDYGSSFVDEPRCDLLADASATARDDRNFARQFRSHQRHVLLRRRKGHAEVRGFED
jgi:hypothetical protein